MVLLAEELANFLKRISIEKEWWCRLPLSISIPTYKTDFIISRIGELFSLPNIAVRIIFTAVGLYELRSNEQLYTVNSNSTEDFKS